MKQPIQLTDGDTYFIHANEEGEMVRDICCHCGYTHMVNYKVIDGIITITTYVDTQYMKKHPARELKEKE